MKFSFKAICSLGVLMLLQGKQLFPVPSRKRLNRSQREGPQVCFSEPSLCRLCSPPGPHPKKDTPMGLPSMSTSRSLSPHWLRDGVGWIQSSLSVDWVTCWSPFLFGLQPPPKEGISSSFCLNCVGFLCFLPLSSGLRIFSTRCSVSTESVLLSLWFTKVPQIQAP